MPNGFKTNNQHNKIVTLNLQENKITKCKAHRSQYLSTHHQQLSKVLLPSTFGT
jgi:hypothetical protein